MHTQNSQALWNPNLLVQIPIIPIAVVNNTYNIMITGKITPAVKQHNKGSNRVEHDLGSQLVTLLGPPECVDTDRLDFAIFSQFRKVSVPE